MSFTRYTIQNYSPQGNFSIKSLATQDKGSNCIGCFCAINYQNHRYFNQAGNFCCTICPMNIYSIKKTSVSFNEGYGLRMNAAIKYFTYYFFTH